MEIVRVLANRALLNSESYQCAYHLGRDESLAPGFYLVEWSSEVYAGSYDERAHFDGPYRSRDEAAAARRHLR